MTGEVGNRVFVHALMQKCRDEKVAEGVQVIGFGQTDFREQGFQVLAERVWVDERTIVLCENVLREWDSLFIAESHFAIAETAQQAEHFFVHRNRSGSPVFGLALLHTLAGNRTAGMLDDDIALVAAGHDHVCPAQGAQLAATHSGIDGEEVKELKNGIFIAEGGEKILHFLHRRNFLRLAFGIWQVDHAGRIFLNDLVAFCVAENGGDNGKIWRCRM